MSNDSIFIYHSDRCPVCMEMMRLCDVSYLNCGHGFHLKCRNTSIQTYRNCPICRQPVENIDEMIDSGIPYSIEPFTDSDYDEDDDENDTIYENDNDTIYDNDDDTIYENDTVERTDETVDEITEDMTEENELIEDEYMSFADKLKFYRKTRIPEIQLYSFLFDDNGDLIKIEEFDRYLQNGNISSHDAKILANLYTNNYPSLSIKIDLYDDSNSRVKRIILYNRTLDTGEPFEEQPLIYRMIEMRDNIITYRDIFLGVKELRVVEDSNDEIEGIYYQGEYNGDSVYEVIFQSNHQLEIQSE